MTKLQKIRRERGLTQLGLAERSGVSLRMIQHYERGEFNFSNVGVYVMLRLANALSVPLYALLSDEAEKAALDYDRLSADAALLYS